MTDNLLIKTQSISTLTRTYWLTLMIWIKNPF